MSKIDLINDSWVDLVFEGKNHAYGAYQLRKETGKRNLYALGVMFLIALIIATIVAVKGVVENAMKSDVAIDADVELSKLAEKTGKDYRLATPEEESQGIDGYVGTVPYSIKPDTYKTMGRLSEVIDVKMIYYTKTKTGLKVEVED